MEVSRSATPAVYASGVPGLAEHLFRQEAGRLVAMLTGIFGIDRLQLAEDAVQEALVRALQTWPYDGVPQNPPAWLMQTAKRLALDVIRREKRFHEKQQEVVATIEQRLAQPEASGDPQFEDEIRDNRLRLIFACCHPALPQEAQTALALKTLCGFSPAEIAKAFLATEAAISKRLTRARQRIQEQQIPFEIPSGAELTPRLEAVLQVIYLLFNEGYKASSGDSLVRDALCHEALRLAMSLLEHPAGAQPRTHALLALMLFNAARLPTRTDDSGNILRLQEQDRSRWDGSLIALGMQHLSASAGGGELTEYHLQAGIAACHCTAATYEATDWPSILAHYDQWLQMSDSPLVALNRAVALAKVEGAEAGLRALETVRSEEQLQSYHLTYAVLGELERLRGRPSAACEHFQRAWKLADSKAERAFLLERIHECEQA